ncbi:hypothetical protein VOLCADRAFT_91900 [Volvox carteri f. nagariensis]|uniref:Uncharacterized protein n=1 Tax=Volvox carteri f. nagariensis TaxID=3068 RepID=D8TY90_VOLCA|nr:uncharacterized protein VOLCADRAFT_91900 [Volvox carteri f. nagariensis]EFJ47602.1 hypothetical protein VOLCADRAFT_91900 [Volvox carteri f. nagariensis]|eukprot:XP_002951426.1 hypothetical protein VOLCADRAFT_91900 [Volvox carteri f. nagariensis]
MECTGATAVSLSMLSQTHDCLVVLARRGPQHLVLPPGSCIAITEPGETAQSLDNPEQHSLQHLYASSAAVVRCVPLLRPLTNALPSTTSAAAVSAAALAGTGGGGGESLPLDWAHLHNTAGITHFAALPLYHGTTLAGALTILGSNSQLPVDAAAMAVQQQQQQVPSQGAVSGSVNGGGGAPISPMGITAYLTAVGSNGGGAGTGAQISPLDSLFRAPLSLELVAMAVAQCCLGADMALARHAVEMVQAMHACASIQQLVAGISLGLQALMHARFCLTLRCNVALAVEFQPNAIMFEEMTGAQQPSGSGSQNNNWAAYDVNPSGQASRVPHITGRPSAAFSSPAHGPDGSSRRELANRMASGGCQPAAGGGGGDGGGSTATVATATGGGAATGGATTTTTGATTTGRGPFTTMRSGVDTTGDPMWGASSGHVTASVLLNQIVGRRYKARPFSVYHTLLIRTIHELAASSYGGTVITQCHDHMQDAKTPSRDIYALGRGVGQPPQSLVLSVTHLRPADEALPDGVLHLASSSDPRAGSTLSGRAGALSHRSNGPPPPGGGGGAAAAVSSSDAPATPPENPSSSAGAASMSAHRMLTAAPAAADWPTVAEPRTYIGLYLSSTEPLPAALLELILVEIHSLACHVLSPLVYRKLLAGELAVEWSLMQTVTTSSLPQGGADSAPMPGRTPRPTVPSPSGAAVLGTPGAAGKSALAKHGRPSMSASEGVARDMMLAAAACGGPGGGGGGGGQVPGSDKFLSTEVATVQDTHSQMGLLVTSYKETLHNMHMELSVGGLHRLLHMLFSGALLYAPIRARGSDLL